MVAFGLHRVKLAQFYPALGVSEDSTASSLGIARPPRSIHWPDIVSKDPLPTVDGGTSPFWAFSFSSNLANSLNGNLFFGIQDLVNTLDFFDLTRVLARGHMRRGEVHKTYIVHQHALDAILQRNRT